MCTSIIFTTYVTDFRFSANFIFTVFAIFLFLIKLNDLPVPLKEANNKLLLANMIHRIQIINIKTCKGPIFSLAPNSSLYNVGIK